MSHRLEDRIKELCAKAITLPDSSPELNKVLKELQTALHEHTQRLRKMVAHFPVPPDRRSFEIKGQHDVVG
jgi:uncharacterized coiled-coil protein SlyX